MATTRAIGRRCPATVPGAHGLASTPSEVAWRTPTSYVQGDGVDGGPPDAEATPGDRSHQVGQDMSGLKANAVHRGFRLVSRCTAAGHGNPAWKCSTKAGRDVDGGPGSQCPWLCGRNWASCLTAASSTAASTCDARHRHVRSRISPSSPAYRLVHSRGDLALPVYQPFTSCCWTMGCCPRCSIQPNATNAGRSRPTG